MMDGDLFCYVLRSTGHFYRFAGFLWGGVGQGTPTKMCGNVVCVFGQTLNRRIPICLFPVGG